jgi:hypothetical protein
MVSFGRRSAIKPGCPLLDKYTLETMIQTRDRDENTALTKRGDRSNSGRPVIVLSNLPAWRRNIVRDRPLRLRPTGADRAVS